MIFIEISSFRCHRLDCVVKRIVWQRLQGLPLTSELVIVICTISMLATTLFLPLWQIIQDPGKTFSGWNIESLGSLPSRWWREISNWCLQVFMDVKVSSSIKISLDGVYIHHLVNHKVHASEIAKEYIFSISNGQKACSWLPEIFSAACSNVIVTLLRLFRWAHVQHLLLLDCSDRKQFWSLLRL